MTLALNIIIRIQMCGVIAMHKSLCIKSLQSKNSIPFGINYPLVVHKGIRVAPGVSNRRTQRNCLNQGVPGAQEIFHLSSPCIFKQFPWCTHF